MVLTAFLLCGVHADAVLTASVQVAKAIDTSPAKVPGLQDTVMMLYTAGQTVEAPKAAAAAAAATATATAATAKVAEDKPATAKAAAVGKAAEVRHCTCCCVCGVA